MISIFNLSGWLSTSISYSGSINTQNTESFPLNSSRKIAPYSWEWKYSKTETPSSETLPMCAVKSPLVLYFHRHLLSDGLILFNDMLV